MTRFIFSRKRGKVISLSLHCVVMWLGRGLYIATGTMKPHTSLSPLWMD